MVSVAPPTAPAPALNPPGGPVSVTGVAACAGLVRGAVSGLDPLDVPLRDAAGMWAEFDTIEKLAGAAKLLLAARVDESRAWERAGCRTVAHWMATVSGTSIPTAQSLMRTARRLGPLPDVTAALRRGELSAAQTEPVADAAAHDPTSQTRLLDAAARSSLSELRQQCLRTKAAADPDPNATYERIRANRRLRQRVDDEGAWCLSGRSTPDAGADFNTILNPLVDEVVQAARAEGRHEPRERYAMDAFMEMARRAGLHDPHHDHGTDTETDDMDGDSVPGNAGPLDVEEPEPTDPPNTDDLVRQTDDVSHMANSTPADTEHPDRGSAEPRAGQTQPDHARNKPHTAQAQPEQPNPTRADTNTNTVTDSYGGSGRGNVGLDPARRADPSTATRSPKRPGRATRPRPRVDVNKLALLRIDLAALARGHPLDGELAEITGYGPVPVNRLRQLLHESVIKLVLTNGQDVASVVHVGRGPNAAQKIALAWTSPTCTRQGCGRTDLEYDHRVPWARCRQTTLDNLDPLCRSDHWLKTHLGWALVHGTGKRPMVPLEDRRHPDNTNREDQPP